MKKGDRASKGVSVQTRLTWLVSALLLVVVLAMGLIVYQVVASELTRVADFQLQGHVSGVAQQAGTLLQTTNSSEFDRDITYEIQSEQRRLKTLGWTVQSDLLGSDGKSMLGQQTAQTLPPQVWKQMVATKSGILQADNGGLAMTYAYQFIPERSMMYVAAVSDNQILAPLNRVRNDMLYVMLGALVAGFLATRFFTRRIVKPLVAMQHVMQGVAAGDLTPRQVTASGMREIAVLGDAVNGMVENLRALLLQVNETSDQVTDSSGALLQSAERTSEGIRQVAAAVQEVSGVVNAQAEGALKNAEALEEMSAGLQQIVDTSGIVAEASVSTAHEAEQGNQAIQDTIRQMNAIRAKVERIAAAILLLEQRSGQVGRIVEVITGIAEQTSLLSLNAAIEAARAGEQGRGFAVVADEVRKLAEQSQGSAKQIAELIAEIQHSTTQAALAMDEGTREVQSGIVVVDQAGLAFQRILRGAEGVALQMQEISTASQQMFSHSKQVIVSVEELTESAQQAAASSQFCASASVEQLAAMEAVFAAADGLSRMSNELQGTIGRFQM